MKPKKEKQWYCDWCGRYLWLMPRNEHGHDLCAACEEDPDYLAVQRHNQTVTRREAKRKGKQ